jgi:putative membrane protein
VGLSLSASDESEPDYRFTLANERTFLAWVRTALALLAAAVALGHLLPGFGPDAVRKIGALALAVLAALTAAVGVWRWRRVQDALDGGAPMPRAQFSWVLSSALVLVSIVVALVILFENGGGS